MASLTSCLAKSAVRPAKAGRRSVQVRAGPAAWFPGKEAPAHLDSKLPGYYGFDPLNLGKDPAALKWYTQAELQNGRWAMLGVAGILVPELLGGATPATRDFNWVKIQTEYPFWTDNKTLFAIAAFLFAWAEGRRWMDMVKPGSVNEDPIFKGNKLPAGEVGYPGGIFDPLGFAKGDIATLKQKEIKNGRLAMVAFFGFLAQYDATGGKTPLRNLADHLANPWAVNFLSNGKSLPFTGYGAGDLNILGGHL